MEIALDDSGQLISLEYGSPEASAECVTWVSIASHPDDVTVQLFEWEHQQKSPVRTTVQDLLAIDT